MSPDDPRHGTYAGAQAHFTARDPLCAPCRLSYRRYQSRRRADVAWGNARIVSALPTRAHLWQLIAGGMTFGAIARVSGVAVTTVQDVRIHDMILSDTADAILGVKCVPEPTGLVPAIGTVRRLRALAALGWGQPAILKAARDSGFNLGTGTIGYVLREVDDTVRVRTHLAVDAAYSKLSMSKPPASRGASYARNRAAALGFAPPLAFDNIDDPDEQPQGAGTSEVDRADVMADVDSWGGNATDAARVLGIERHNLQKWCQRAGHSELYRRLAAREAMHGNQWTEGAA